MNTKEHELFKVFRENSCSFVANLNKSLLFLSFCAKPLLTEKILPADTFPPFKCALLCGNIFPDTIEADRSEVMSRKLSLEFMQKSYRAIFCTALLSAAMAAISGCATISGKQSRAEKTARDISSGRNIQELTGKKRQIFRLCPLCRESGQIRELRDYRRRAHQG
jgi:hypothetical protein